MQGTQATLGPPGTAAHFSRQVCCNTSRCAKKCSVNAMESLLSASCHGHASTPSQAAHKYTRTPTGSADAEGTGLADAAVLFSASAPPGPAFRCRSGKRPGTGEHRIGEVLDSAGRLRCSVAHPRMFAWTETVRPNRRLMLLVVFLRNTHTVRIWVEWSRKTRLQFWTWGQTSA